MKYQTGRFVHPPAVIPPTGQFRTMISGQALPTTRWGTNPIPDAHYVDANGANLVGSGTNRIQTARNAGACIITRFVGNGPLKNPDCSFSVANFKTEFNSFADEVGAPGSAGEAELRLAVRDGVYRGLYILDDFREGVPCGTGDAYLNPVIYEEIEECCHHIKLRWPWMPLVARAPNVHMKSLAAASGVVGNPFRNEASRINGVRQYAYLDAGWGQMRRRLDVGPGKEWATAADYVDSNVLDGEACSLGFVGGLNVSNQGSGAATYVHPISGLTKSWGCRAGTAPGGCACNPAEVHEVGLAMLANPAVHGYLYWSYQTTPEIFDDPDMVSAMADILQRSIGRTDGLLNIRGDLVPA